MKKISLLVIAAALLLLTACVPKSLSGGKIADELEKELDEAYSEPVPTSAMERTTGLDAFRQEMKPPLMAAAFLAYVDGGLNYDLIEYLTDEYPSFMEKNDYIGKIPEERTFGICGSVYCIVPRDENSSVTVSAVIPSQQLPYPVDRVLYTSGKGDPILVFGEADADTVIAVEIQDPDGRSIIWYPHIGEYYSSDEYLAPVIMDFTPALEKTVLEIYRNNGWTSIGVDYIADTFWVSDYGWAMELKYEPGQLYDGEAALYSVVQEEEYILTHTGHWVMEQGNLRLEMEPADDSGEAVCDVFPVLKDPWDIGYLWIGRSESGGGVPYFWDGMDSDELIQPLG